MCVTVSAFRGRREKKKKKGNLSSCLSITGPWRTATEQVLASPSGAAPATKTSPERHQPSSTRVLQHCPARRAPRHTKTTSLGWANTPEEEGSLQPFPLGSDTQEQMQGSSRSIPSCPGDSAAIPLALPSAWRGWNEWLCGWPCWLCAAGIHTSWLLIEQALHFHPINPFPPENKSYQKVKWQIIDKITSDIVRSHKPVISRLKIQISCCMIVTRMQCWRGNTAGNSAGQFSSVYSLKSLCLCNQL